MATVWNFEVMSDRSTQRVRVPEKRLLQEVLQPERQEVKGDWRKMHNEELHENCAFTQQVVVPSCGRFGTTIWILDR